MAFVPETFILYPEKLNFASDKAAYTYMKRYIFSLYICITGCLAAMATQRFAPLSFPKRETRAVWLTTFSSLDWPKNKATSPAGIKAQQDELCRILDRLKEVNINTVLLQTRVRGSVIYPSAIEPWDGCLTGTPGRAPGYDPLAFAVRECHKRGMELHAWLVAIPCFKISAATRMGNRSVLKTHPKLCVRHGDSWYLDPGQPETADYLASLCREIAANYDVDGIHFDYIRYPENAAKFNDASSYRKYGKRQNKADWRRSNVNILIKKIHETIREITPWVKFGISPFGIYRNESSDPLGSKTNGLQNYDDLYADVLLWAREGWIDYNIPQIYWEIGHKAADYETLVKWWATHSENRPLFIGQSVTNTIQHADPQNPSMNQLPRKMALQRAYQTIGGSCQWYAAAVVENQGRYRDALVSEYHKYPALIPVFDFMDDKAPDKVRKMKKIWTEDGYVLFWTAPKAETEMDKAVQYVVYRFGRKEKVNLDDPSHIVAITRNPFYKLPYETGKTKYRYVVTALDRLHNESKSVSKKVKL